ncbi:MAG: type III pantothenate kinase [Erysipelotrichaceae bacterium]|nr:type III pantothenate kinase [Erysipelotrichaceae bacterium]
MLLTIDLGNTSLKLGIFNKDEEVAFTIIHNSENDDYLAIIKNFLYRNNLNEKAIHDIIISNVVPFAYKGLINASRTITGKDPIIIDARNPLGIKLDVDDPFEVGSDLIVMSAYGHALYQKDLFIVSFGSATAISYVTADGRFKNCIIAPGFNAYGRSLSNLACLPEMVPNNKKNFAASNTNDALNVGVYQGFIGMLRYLLAGFKGELQVNPSIIACGGQGKEIVKNIKDIEEYEPDFVTKGLHYLYKEYFNNETNLG